MKLHLLRKIINKKNLLFIFAIFSLTFAPVLVSQAMDQSFISPTAANVSVISQNGSATIINRSDKRYFVPNKTSPEWNSFQQNPPKYVSIAVCDDGVCSEGEDSTTCPEDCPVATGYCGDGVCSNTQVEVTYSPPKVVDRYEKVCVKKRSGWLWVPIVGIVLLATGNDKYTQCDYANVKVSVTTGWEPAGEVYAITNTSIRQQVCKDDCMPPSGSGCGSCGYDSSGNLCPNYCSNRGYNMINCSYHSATVNNSSGCAQQEMVYNDNPIKKYFTASEALANAAAVACQSSSFTTSGGYGCNYGGDTSALCPAGQYCPDTGGLKPGTSLTSWNPYATAPSCGAGSFCPLGSIFQRICPKNTYSTGGASVCTACPSGTISMPGANNIDKCAPFYKANDGVCNNAGDGINGETPASSPFDCPDTNTLAKWKNDGRCTGIENSTNSPSDCHCGNGTCDDSETALSCLVDCACMDSTCGTRKYNSSNYTWTVFNEGKFCNSYGSQVANVSDCKYMNAGEVCGNGTCESGEGYRSDIARIVCPLDCHCGNGYCETGETMANCGLDCFCGDGSCNHGEYSGSCPSDCHCGNGQCEGSYNENATNCSTDCRCGDHICSYGEDYSSCSTDCPLEIGSCGDGVCGYTDLGNGKTRKETIANCAVDCGLQQMQ